MLQFWEWIPRLKHYTWMHISFWELWISRMFPREFGFLFWRKPLPFAEHSISGCRVLRLYKNSLEKPNIFPLKAHCQQLQYLQQICKYSLLANIYEILIKELQLLLLTFQYFWHECDTSRRKISLRRWQNLWLLSINLSDVFFLQNQ